MLKLSQITFKIVDSIVANIQILQVAKILKRADICESTYRESSSKHMTESAWSYHSILPVGFSFQYSQSLW